jgi:hypothetical protein
MRRWTNHNLRLGSAPNILIFSALDLYEPMLLGSEIYVGCSNGELLRFVLQADNPDTVRPISLLRSICV